MLKSFLFNLLFLFSTQLFAQTITVGNGGDFPNLSDAEAFIDPGDTVIILDQTFSAGTQFLTNLNGTPTQPIVILAETLHQPLFMGGTEAIHLVNCSYMEINGLVFEGQTGNGVNIDDGGDYSSPSTHITVQNCIFRNIATPGNHDFLKMSGVDDFLVENCRFTNGTGGSGIDLVGCHNGVIQDCFFDQSGVTGIQCKGGTQFITIQRNVFKNMSQRALNLGGSTGLQFFRPPLSNPIENAFEAADLEVFSNVFVGSRAPIAYVGCVRVNVVNNTFYKPDNWVIRILQETTEPGFLTCSDNVFANNIVFQASDLTEVNIGPNTAPESFTFTNNLWYNELSDTWAPNLPAPDANQVIGNPLFTNETMEDFTLQSNSPAIGMGDGALNPFSDFDLRPYADPPSIGAYEGATSVNATNPLESSADHVKIYPNPSRETFTIEFEKQPHFTTFMITDLWGKTIYEKREIQARLIRLELEQPAGIYLLLLASENSVKVLRLLKQ